MLTDESMILHFIRNMNALETDHEDRYDVRGHGDSYTVWDNYLLQEVDDMEHTSNIAHYVRLAADLNAQEAATQHDYDKKAYAALELDVPDGNN
jgi:hypothetical protein